MKRPASLAPIWQPFTQSVASVYAASACFYCFLSLVPAWQLTQRLLQGSRSFQTLLPLITALWSGSKGIWAILEGLNVLLPPSRKPSWLRKRLWALASFLLLTMSLSLSSTILVFGRQVLQLLTDLLPGPAPLLQMLLRFRFLTAFLFLWALFSLSYRFLPRRVLNGRSSLLSGALVSLSWLVFSFGLSIATNYVNFKRSYGQMTFFVLSALWLRGCLLLYLWGALLCRLLTENSYHPWRTIRAFFTIRS